MSTLKQRSGMALLLCAAIAACSANRGYDSNSSIGSGTNGSSVGTATGVSDAGNAATAGSTGSTGTDMSGNTTSTSSAQPTVSYGTVQTIEPGTRQDIGVGTLGGAAAGGTVGSPSDKVYRVTVRMDDGSTQSIVLDTMPSSYRVGDRVRYSNGSLQRGQ